MYVPSTPKRAAVKAITYRVTTLVANFILTFIIIELSKKLNIVRSFDITLILVISGSIVSSILYYIHERIWSKKLKKFGKTK